MRADFIRKYSCSVWVIAIAAIGVPSLGVVYYLCSKSGEKGNFKSKSVKKSEVEFKDNTTTSKSDMNETVTARVLTLKAHGNQAYKEGKYLEAIKCFSEAISLCPPDKKEYLAILCQNIAAAYECLGETCEVVKYCTDALKFKPIYIKALKRRYKASEKLGNLRECLEDITFCLYIQRFCNEEDIANADRILDEMGIEEAKKYMANKPMVMPSTRFMEQYFSSLANDPLKKVIEHFVEEESGNLTHIDSAKSALKKGDYETVIKECDKEINLVHETSKETSNSYYEALLIRGTLHVIINESVRAKADLDIIIGSSDADKTLVVSALLKRASIYMQAEETELAFGDFAQAEALLPENPDIYHQKAQLLLLSCQLEAALVEFQKANNLCPDFSIFQMHQLFTQFKYIFERGDKQNALLISEEFRGLLCKNPEITEGYLLLAQMYNELQDMEQYRKVINEAVKVDPNNPIFHVHIGLLHLICEGQRELALKEFQKAIELDPKCGFAFETFAATEVERGNLLNAISLFDKALPLSKSFKKAAYIFSLKIAAQTQHTVSSRLGSFKM